MPKPKDLAAELKLETKLLGLCAYRLSRYATDPDPAVRNAPDFVLTSEVTLAAKHVENIIRLRSEIRRLGSN